MATARFRNVQEMAQAVNESAKLIEGRSFTARPYNRFDPGKTDWWIVPSTAWPAYRYGKGVFKPTKRFAGQVLCGLHVEKGFGATVGAVYPGLVRRGHIVDRDWAWPGFLKSLDDGSVAAAARRAAKAVGEPVIVEISAGYSTSPDDYEPHSLTDDSGETGEECRSEVDGGLVWFTPVDDELRRVDQRCIRDVMERVASCRRLSLLPQAFTDTPDLPWAWIDLYIGTLVSLVSEGEARGGEWHASGIWRELMRPWLTWIR